MKIPQIKIKVTLTKGEKYTIKNSSSAVDILRQLFSKDTILFNEEMILLALNNQNDVFGWYRLSVGGRTGTVCDPRIVFSILLNAGASGFILSHNHPSGKLVPSDADLRITRQLKEAGELLSINLLDHIIISDEGYLSMADQNLGSL